MTVSFRGKMSFPITKGVIDVNQVRSSKSLVNDKMPSSALTTFSIPASAVDTAQGVASTGSSVGASVLDTFSNIGRGIRGVFSKNNVTAPSGTPARTPSRPPSLSQDFYHSQGAVSSPSSSQASRFEELGTVYSPSSSQSQGAMSPRNSNLSLD